MRTHRYGCGNFRRGNGKLCYASSVTLGSTACHQRPTVEPGYHEYAYVTNGQSNSVSVLDLLQLRNVKTIPVGASPTGVAASPTRNEIYVANADSNNISIINAERNVVEATIGVHRAPYFVSVSSDGKRAYVANSGSANVSVIDLDKRAVIATIRVGGAPGLARVSPDGKLVVVSNRADNTVSIIDTQKLAVRSTVPVLPAAAGPRHPARFQQGVRGVPGIESARLRRSGIGPDADPARRGQDAGAAGTEARWR